MRALAKTLMMLVALLLVAVAQLAAQTDHAAHGSAHTSAADTTTVYLVRHAEKADDSADPLLSDAGSARAEALATLLGDANVRAIYTTHLQRTRLTARPLAERIGVTPVALQVTSTAAHIADVVQHVKQNSGHAVLVVGHSNTVPAYIRALGGPADISITDPEYDNLFVLKIAPDGSATLDRRRYGGSK